jgi:hypothetical protein
MTETSENSKMIARLKQDVTKMSGTRMVNGMTKSLVGDGELETD